MRPEDQERVLVELSSRVLRRHTDLTQSDVPRLDEVLADSVYHELRRLKDDAGSKAHRADLAFWNDLRRRLPRAGERTQRTLLGTVAHRYAHEIAGHFDERVYGLITRAGEPVLGLLLNAVSPKRLLKDLPHLPRLDDNIVLQGEIEHLRRLHELGTVIVVPTHVSNMDSIVMGYVLWRMGLPPFLYGAGLNLFSNPILGFFMRHLGAYTVDRRKQDPLYKYILKEYATLTLENGYDNIFFPGGTRSRSGGVERKLKLGLLGTGLSAYVNNLLNHKITPRVYVVPCTLSYQLVLEAETLVDDFLKDVGKHRYIITDDEFSRPQRVFEFLQQLFSLDSKVYFTAGRGMDPFANLVDEHGESLDPRGRQIDPSRYVLLNGVPAELPQRDTEYTREVGERLTDAYASDTVIQSTHLTARALFTLMRRASPGVDLIRLIRAGGDREDFALLDVYQEADRILSQLRGLAARGGVRLTPGLMGGSSDDVVADGLRHFAIYHKTAAAERRGDRVFPSNRSLLFYYQNRLEGYRIDRDLGLAPALSADHRALGGAGA
jgi:glycerol-3-phosphate O-acyltransferase